MDTSSFFFHRRVNPMQGRLLPVVWPSLTKQIYGAVQGRFGSFVTTVHGNPLLSGCRRRRGTIYTYTLSIIHIMALANR